MVILELLQSVAALVVLVLGAFWGYFKWRKRREHAPRLEFTVDVNFVGLHKGQWLVEVLALVDNKGLVQHRIREFSFDLRTLDVNDPIEEGEKEINYQTRIPRKVKEAAWIPRDWESTFIEPGLKTRYSYVVAVPRTAKFVLVHGKFDYGRKGLFHTSDKLVAVPESNGELAAANA